MPRLSASAPATRPTHKARNSLRYRRDEWATTGPPPTAQPTAALDGLCAGDEKELRLGMRILNEVRSRKNLVARVPQDELLGWCDQEPKARYPAMARLITISHRTGEAGPLQWTSLTLRFLEKAPDPGEILKEFVSQFVPVDGWSGSLAAILEAHGTSEIHAKWLCIGMMWEVFCGVAEGVRFSV